MVSASVGHQLHKAGLGFIGYSESLPKTGFRGCTSRRYVRKHNPYYSPLLGSGQRPTGTFETKNSLPSLGRNLAADWARSTTYSGCIATSDPGH